MIGKLLRLMLEYSSGPLTTLQEALMPAQHDITLSETAYEAEPPASQNTVPGSVKYNGPVKTCTGCGGNGEDPERYEPLFDVYAPCSTCHGSGTVPLDDLNMQGMT